MIYRDSNSTIEFGHPSGADFDVEVSRNSVVLQTTTVTGTEDAVLGSYAYEFDLDWELTESEGDLKIRYFNEDVDRSFFETVVVPFVRLSRLQTAFDVPKTSDELKAIEVQVRMTIQNYTGQSFGYYKGVLTAVGQGGNSLYLPMRLNDATDITGGTALSYGILDDGWVLTSSRDELLEIKMAPPEGNVYATYGVIRVPDWSGGFTRGAVFTIDGEWGYKTVPEDIQQAALMLAKDYSEEDGPNYGNMGLAAYKAADWTLQWQKNAFSSTSTGNKRVDQILDSYQRPFYGVI